MAEKITDTLIKTLPAPGKGQRITYDTDVKGFGVRVTAAGARSFILNYRTRSGRERRYTIGSFPDWKASAARTEASELKMRIDRGEDPMAEVEADRNAKTVADLCNEFEQRHLTKVRPATKRDYEALIRREILPAMKHLKVAEVTFSDVDDLHRKITKRGATYLANRTVAILSKMFSLAMKWGWRDNASGNPAKGIERNQEAKRHRYLTPKELARLTGALAQHDDVQATNIIRLLLLTGARRNEVQSVKWADIDFEAGVWTKPGSTTKQKTTHRVPLSAPALQLLVALRAKADKAKVTSEYIFPGRGNKNHRLELKKDWRELCIAADLVDTKTEIDAKGQERVIVTPNARLHDLRHTYASVLASAGLSLPIIGALLGHSQPATTARYSHLMDDPLRQATERVGAIVMPTTEGAEIVPRKGKAS
nr:site-specific integrase [Ochrobactrum sp. UNC390CL2Tsu3S39]